MSNTILTATDLSKSYSDGKATLSVFEGVKLSVCTGEMLAIVGRSGSGKSSLLHVLGGLDTPTAGDVQINGESLFKLPEKKRCHLRNQLFGFVYQFHHLLPEFDALDNVAMPLMIRGLDQTESRNKALAMIERVGLLSRAQARIGELSGGERQRIAIARALVGSPACVLADEPTGNLDESTAEQIAGLMRVLNQELGTSFIVVTHHQAMAASFDRMLMLENGRLHGS